MFSPEKLFHGYGDYRESIGRPRVNKVEDLKESIPYNHFLAGVAFALKELEKEVPKDGEDPLDAL